MTTKKIVVWIAVIAIILSFLGPLFISFFDIDEASVSDQTNTGTLSN